WARLGGNLLAGTAPAAVHDNNGSLMVAAVGIDHRVWLLANVPGFGFSMGVLGGRTISDPGIAFIDGTRQAPNAKLAVVFVRGTDNALWDKQVNLPVMTFNGGWHSVGGNLTSGPAAASAGLTFVLALGTDNQPWFRGGTWPTLGAWTRG